MRIRLLPKLRRLTRPALIAAAVIGAYALVAYWAMPALLRHYEHMPSMQAAPKTASTAEHLPGDPLNVGLIGSEDQVVDVLLSAGWVPANPRTFRTGFRLARRVLTDRPYAEAPVSDLYLWGRCQDLAFEQPAASSPARRHHVRFWQATELGAVDGKSLWIGSATFDRGVGFSHTTGQITHHIDPDVDAERDRLIGDLIGTGRISQIYQVTGVGVTLRGRNGGGDWYYTDGEVTVAVIADPNAPPTSRPVELGNPPVVRIKNQLWTWARQLLGHPDPPADTTQPARPH